MEQYKLDASLYTNKVFLVKRSELENRIDPNPYSKDRVEAIKSLAKNNQLIKLKDVVRSNKTIAKNISSDDIYIGLENIISETGEYIETAEKESISSANKFKKGQILFPKLRPYLNKVYYTEFDGLCSTEFHVFESKNSDFDTEFLAIYLRLGLIVNQTKHLMTGNTLPRLQTSDIENLPIPKINQAIQYQIVDIYNNAYAQKQAKEAEAKELLASIDTYLLNELGITLPEKDNSLEARIFTTKFSEVGRRFDPISFKTSFKNFLNGTYASEALKNVILKFKSGQGAGRDDQSDEELGIIQIRPTNIGDNGNLKFHKNVYIPLSSGYDKLDLNDVLFNNTNSQELVGKTTVLKENLDLTYSNHITVLKVNEHKLNADYLGNILNSFQKHKIFYSICTNWNNQSGVGLDLLKNIQIPLPPLEKQNEIAEHIAAIQANAKALQEIAEQILTEAKQQIEQIILG